MIFEEYLRRCTKLKAKTQKIYIESLNPSSPMKNREQMKSKSEIYYASYKKLMSLIEEHKGKEPISIKDFLDKISTLSENTKKKYVSVYKSQTLFGPTEYTKSVFFMATKYFKPYEVYKDSIKSKVETNEPTLFVLPKVEVPKVEVPKVEVPKVEPVEKKCSALLDLEEVLSSNLKNELKLQLIKILITKQG